MNKAFAGAFASVSILVLGCAKDRIASTYAPPNPTSIYDFRATDIDGAELPLKKFEGQVLLVVNVASECIYTPQYKGLEATYEKYHAEGFEVLGFPANDFGEQEPGSNSDIKRFCTSNFKVTFPMFAKITVLGPKTHPLYKWLVSSSRNQKPIGWNFTKFLVDRKGHVVGRFESPVDPGSPELNSAIQEALKS